MAPCLLETNFSKRKLHSRYTAAGIGIREVPAYLDKIPAAASPILRSTDSLPQRSAVLKRQRVPAVFRNAHHDVPDTQHPDTDQCNPACFRLHRLLRLQSASPAEKFHHLCWLHCRLHRNCNFCGLPHARSQSGRILDRQHCHMAQHQLSVVGRYTSHRDFCNYAAPISVLLGSWYRATSCSKKNNCSLWTSRPTNRYTSRL
mgnify:CR=1 FL=1